MNLECKHLAQYIKYDCARRVSKLPKRPWLLIIQVAGDAASDAYTKGKKRDCDEVGITCVHELLPNDASLKAVHDVIDWGNQHADCVGIILQLPLPKHLAPYQDYLLESIWHNKDVDGFSAKSPYDPCTPAGIIKLMKTWYATDTLADKVVLVVGRGKLVGAPLYNLLNRENATIIQANSHTGKDTLKEMISVADVVVTATGRPDTINFYNAGNYNGLIIDAGISRDGSGKLCGDCDKALYYSPDAYITPVPGGVGLLTRAMLMKNVVDAAYKQWGIEEA